MRLRKYVSSPENRRWRHRTEASRPSALSESSVGIANLEGEVAGVDAEEIQLFERRVPGGPREVERKRQLVVGRRRLKQNADRSPRRR